MTDLLVDFEKRLGDFHLSPRFEAGSEIVVLLGPSGSGKTLTLRAVAGLLKPDKGRIQLAGEPVFDASKKLDLAPPDRGVGYVVQNLALFPHMSVAENLGFALRAGPRADRERRVRELIEDLGLQGLSSRLPKALSGGQQQRVALGRALAAHPRVLLLDEPFSALDTALRAQLRRQVMRLQRQMNLTTLFVTHDLQEAYAMADKLAVFDNGQVLQAGSRAEVFRSPASVRVAELLETRNIFPGRVVGRMASLVEVETGWFSARARAAAELGVGDKAAICVRPEHVVLLDAEADPRPFATVLTFEIDEIVSTGASHRLYGQAAVSAGGSAANLEVDVSDRDFERVGVNSKSIWQVALPEEASVAIPM